MTGQPQRSGERIDQLAEQVAVDLDAGFAQVVVAHASTVYSTALRVSRQPADADDLASETFMRAYQAMQAYPPEKLRGLALRPWLVTIVLNLWRNHLRDASRRPTTVPFGPVHPACDPADGPEQTAVGQSELGDIGRLLAGLPELQRIPIVLRHVVGMSYTEIATVLECPVGSAKSQVSRGLAALRSQLHPLEEALP